MSHHKSQESLGYPVTNIIFPLIEGSGGKERLEFPSEYPEEFLCAFQTEQVGIGRILKSTDEQLQFQIMPSLMNYFPQVTVQEFRNSVESMNRRLINIAQILRQLHEEANHPVVTKNVSHKFIMQPRKYPRVRTYDGKVYIPKLQGWCQRDGSDAVDLASEDGMSIWQVVIDTISNFQRCLMILIQTDPKKLTQAEFDILYAFELIDRRVVLSQAERDLRIALKTPVEFRTEQMKQMLGIRLE